MKKACIFMLLALAIPGSAWADWNDGDPAKWIQFPDLTPEGMDVNATHPMLLADDFLCEETGPITGIHIWGSWLEDRLPFNNPEAVRFVLSLHADIPADESPTGFSMPGEPLWVIEFPPGYFQARVWAGDLVEGWFDPQDDQYTFPGDWTCWQYNFSIPESMAYVQQGEPNNPVVYWLDVQAYPEDPEAFFGWKTSPDHWNDDAVWGFGDEPYPGPWNELRYPLGHPFHPESIDLAFVIQGEGQPQDELDFGDAWDGPLFGYPTLLGNNGANHVIGGPWLGPPDDSPDPEPDGQPTVNANGDDMDVDGDDEDGVQIPILASGGTFPVQFEVNGSTGNVVGWIDFDQSFTWDAGEQIVSGLYPPGVHVVNFTVPASAVPGQTTARFRITSNVALPPDGPAPDGEVEDHPVFIEEVQQELDYGDAPNDATGAGYPTLLSSNGARHGIVTPAPWLGPPDDFPDPELDGQPDPNALGDDNDGNDDEDGVQLPVMTPGSSATFQFFVNGPIGGGWVDGWIDFDQDQVWTAAEQVVSGFYPNGIHGITITVPGSAVPGQTFARFRINSIGPLPPDGPAQDGEVEDHEVVFEEIQEELDFGDAPDDSVTGYPTYLSNNGARHYLGGTWLGPNNDSPDPDPDGQPHPAALGDDLDADGDDEDGVQIPILVPGGTATIQFQVSAGAGHVTGWIDFNQDRIWTGGEQVVSGVYAPGNHLINVTVPAGALLGQTFARFRITTTGPLPPTGLAQDGEVEDHEVHIEDFGDELDFGDAPDDTITGYPTYLSSNGARHLLGGPWFGPLDDAPDPEINGQPDPTATGDDNDGNDDEDGFQIPILVPGTIATIQFQVNGGIGGAVAGWIDFNQDRVWSAGEQVIAASFAPGFYTLNVTVPPGAIPGQTFARFRIASTGPLPPIGLAQDGEVEDHEVFIEGIQIFEDFGDAPDDTVNGYPTLLINNGARHIASGPWLGDAADPPDVENDGQPDPNALGDDTDANGDDEDGVQIPGLIIGQPATITFEVNGGPAEVSGWIDFNGDRIWQAAEQVVGGNFANGFHSQNVIAPAGSIIGQTFSRFRISTLPGLAPAGPAPDGEVEDHEVLILDDPQSYKWQQLPDLDPTGIDINCSLQWPYLLADDFLCTQTGPLTQIQIWGSWLNDYLPFGQDPHAVRFQLSIHEDIPAEQSPTGYSMPGELLHLFDFEPGIFAVDLYAEGLEEGWMNPPDDYNPLGDTICWLYTFDIDPDQTFFQVGSPDNPVVYWLDLQATPLDPDALFGWKTSWEHWNDDAVWIDAQEPYIGDWFELRYPPGHPFAPESIDLAFRIFGEPGEQRDFGDAMEPPYPTTLANNGAFHLIVPGLFLGNAVDAEPGGQPHPLALGDDNNGIDDEDGVFWLSGPLRPGGVASIDVIASAHGFLDAWIDFQGDGSWATAGDQVFFSQPLGPGSNPLNFTTPATGVIAHYTVARFRFSSLGGLPFTGPAPDGEVEDHRIFVEDDLTDVPDMGPQSFRLYQSSPNPFNPMTTIRFDLPSEELVELTVFTVDGRKIATLVRESMEAGRHDVVWNGVDDAGQRVASGTYFYRIQAGPYRQTERMVLVK